MRPAQLFVYYRVRREALAEAVVAIRDRQRAWRAALPGLHAELLERHDDEAAPTLMEIYRHDQGVSAEWRERFEREAAAVLAGALIGVRHVEAFAPCA